MDANDLVGRLFREIQSDRRLLDFFFAGRMEVDLDDEGRCLFFTILPMPSGSGRGV